MCTEPVNAIPLTGSGCLSFNNVYRPGECPAPYMEWLFIIQQCVQNRWVPYPLQGVVVYRSTMCTEPVSALPLTGSRCLSFSNVYRTCKCPTPYMEWLFIVQQCAQTRCVPCPLHGVVVYHSTMRTDPVRALPLTGSGCLSFNNAHRPGACPTPYREWLFIVQQCVQNRWVPYPLQGVVVYRSTMCTEPVSALPLTRGGCLSFSNVYRTGKCPTPYREWLFIV